MADTMLKALQSVVKSTTKEWQKQKRRDYRMSHYTLQEMRDMKPDRVTIKEAAFEVMEEAYLLASGNGKYPVNARQLMYAVRPRVLELTGGKCWKTSSYFTQNLLIEFMDDNSELCKGWDLLFDARGHISEPHTDERADLGTADVRRYIKSWHNKTANQNLDMSDLLGAYRYGTSGPANRYEFALFIEKEGFDPLLKAARIAQRYDLAIFSSKGMPPTAARELVEKLSGHGVTILVLHDFDKSGFSILKTLQSDNRRYVYTTKPNVIDLGLRLNDVKQMGLEGEVVTYHHRDISPKWNLQENGATDEEISYLVDSHNYTQRTGKRVELNSMSATQFITWLEGKLKKAGVKKVVPSVDVLNSAYRDSIRLRRFQDVIKTAQREIEELDITVPRGLVAKVRKNIQGTGDAWDDAIWSMTEGEEE